MAYNDSGSLSPDSAYGYNLGAYNFNITVTPDPGESTTGINVRCRNTKTQETARVSSEVQGTVKSWRVEANDTTADVYVTVKKARKTDDKTSSDIPIPIHVAHGQVMMGTPSPLGEYSPVFIFEYENLVVMSLNLNYGVIFCSKESGVGKRGFNQWRTPTEEELVNVNVRSTYTHNGKTVYFYVFNSGYIMNSSTAKTNDAVYEYVGNDPSRVAWTAIYGTDVIEYDGEEEILVARFEIDLETADGGPDGSWEEPGDTGDPTYTLNLSVTGATTGTHDALSFPSDNTTEKGYGCGGDGGHGGGGGAGSSTVILYEFATSKAGNVVQEAFTRPPGAGSGGGKGGKGGDGCILIFY